ncbi:hypothetical protein O9G_003685 [Rozella allomycis CSF55]|uniref:C2CD3 N-terminal C2 domain-containing protein n=1 Tax=Rozella allomycis (strain CSF55) TaxID=988480 RepID=A0A075B381_ROZAC|nr:hypothetical protein O9G_003685 [Rozella allomycis CSF55]|eukprot:EPZ35426.1 hypothetical protein O9G_003685 [Rozella allomycis CSF55]
MSSKPITSIPPNVNGGISGYFKIVLEDYDWVPLTKEEQKMVGTNKPTIAPECTFLWWGEPSKSSGTTLAPPSLKKISSKGKKHDNSVDFPIRCKKDVFKRYLKDMGCGKKVQVRGLDDTQGLGSSVQERGKGFKSSIPFIIGHCKVYLSVLFTNGNDDKLKMDQSTKDKIKDDNENVKIDVYGSDLDQNMNKIGDENENESPRKQEFKKESTPVPKVAPFVSPASSKCSDLKIDLCEEKPMSAEKVPVKVEEGVKNDNNASIDYIVNRAKELRNMMFGSLSSLQNVADGKVIIEEDDDVASKTDSCSVVSSISLIEGEVEIAEILNYSRINNLPESTCGFESSIEESMSDNEKKALVMKKIREREKSREKVERQEDEQKKENQKDSTNDAAGIENVVRNQKVNDEETISYEEEKGIDLSDKNEKLEHEKNIAVSLARKIVEGQKKNEAKEIENVFIVKMKQSDLPKGRLYFTLKLNTQGIKIVEESRIYENENVELEFSLGSYLLRRANILLEMWQVRNAEPTLIGIFIRIINFDEDRFLIAKFRHPVAQSVVCVPLVCELSHKETIENIPQDKSTEIVSNMRNAEVQVEPQIKNQSSQYSFDKPILVDQFTQTSEEHKPHSINITDKPPCIVLDNKSQSVEINEKEGTLINIGIERARNLPNITLKHFPNSKVKIGNCITKVVMNEENPTWDASFDIHQISSLFEFCVETSLLQNEIYGWYNIVDFKGCIQGQLLLRILPFYCKNISSSVGIPVADLKDLYSKLKSSLVNLDNTIECNKLDVANKCESIITNDHKGIHHSTQNKDACLEISKDIQKIKNDIENLFEEPIENINNEKVENHSEKVEDTDNEITEINDNSIECDNEEIENADPLIDKPIELLVAEIDKGDVEKIEENVQVEYLSVENTSVEIVPVENVQVDNTPIDDVNTPIDDGLVEMVPEENFQVDKDPVDNASVENVLESTPVKTINRVIMLKMRFYTNATLSAQAIPLLTFPLHPNMGKSTFPIHPGAYQRIIKCHFQIISNLKSLKMQ